jgi:tRNA/rRNA methyltransferase
LAERIIAADRRSSSTPRIETVPLYNRLLLTHAKFVEIVLVSPRNPLNVGAVARAMANFGFTRLTVVAPFAPHWREAQSAVGAPELLLQARETETLAEAIAECALVIGTGTLTYRKPEQAVISLPHLPPLVEAGLARNGRVAIVFGPEKHGLTREDLSWCHALIEIPTDSRQPSMNLGQAVAVCLYELSSRSVSAPVTVPVADPVSGQTEQSPNPSSGNLDMLAGVIEETMLAAGYSPRSMQAANRHDLRLLLRRLSPGSKDTRRMLGLFRRILWKLRQDPKGK